MAAAPFHTVYLPNNSTKRMHSTQMHYWIPSSVLAQSKPIETTRHKRGAFTQGVLDCRGFIPLRLFLPSPKRGWPLLVSS